LYIKALDADELPNEIEILSEADRYNEYIMTGLRTIWGVSLNNQVRIRTSLFGLFKQKINS
jgi:oxygen-independent coproporphyrinogen-3 oxidase